MRALIRNISRQISTEKVLKVYPKEIVYQVAKSGGSDSLQNHEPILTIGNPFERRDLADPTAAVRLEIDPVTGRLISYPAGSSVIRTRRR